jgi:hypothetical protein
MAVVPQKVRSPSFEVAASRTTTTARDWPGELVFRLTLRRWRPSPPQAPVPDFLGSESFIHNQRLFRPQTDSFFADTTVMPAAPTVARVEMSRTCHDRVRATYMPVGLMQCSIASTYGLSWYPHHHGKAARPR